MKKFGLAILFSCAFLQARAADLGQEPEVHLDMHNIHLIALERRQIGRTQADFLHAYFKNGDEVYVAYSSAHGTRVKFARCREGQPPEKVVVGQSWYDAIEKWSRNRRQVEGDARCQCALHRKDNAQLDDENKWDGEL